MSRPLQDLMRDCVHNVQSQASVWPKSPGWKQFAEDVTSAEKTVAAMQGALSEVWLWLESTGHVMGLSELVEDALKQARGES